MNPSNIIIILLRCRQSKSTSIHSVKSSVVFAHFRCQQSRVFSSRLNDLLLNMPKVPVHLEKLKAQRKDKKDNSVKYNAGFINLQVLGNGAKGAPTSLYVFTDQTRYIFNCGEGSQRLAHEHKLKLSKLEHVFITSRLWSRIGGLPGLALTIQDIGIPSLTIHGPPQLEKLFEATQRFIILKDLQILTSDCTQEETGYYEDHVMRIDYVPLYSFSNEPSSENITSEPEGKNNENDDTVDYYANAKASKRQLGNVKNLNEKRARTSDMVYQDCTVCYICKPKPKPGSLIIEKCVEMGVPPGPLLGKLKLGEDVTLTSGKLVKASDVTTPNDPGPVFIIVDCPHERYIESLVTNKAFVAHQMTGGNDECAEVVVHFTPGEIMRNPTYVKWMESFKETTKHLIMNDLCEGTGSEAIHRAQLKLHQLDKEVFPLLGETDIPIIGRDDLQRLVTKKSNVLESVRVPVLMGISLLKFNLRPTIGLDASSGIRLNPDLYMQEMKDNDGFEHELNKYRSRLEDFRGECNEYPKIIFLGTGSCIPNKTRNTSGILIQLTDDSAILLDCGEGTFGQLTRFFGSTLVDRKLTAVKAVYISHLHADHHLGLLSIIMERVKAFNRLDLPFKPLILIAPFQISSWLNLFNKYFDKIETFYELFPNSNLHLNGPKISPEDLNTNILEPLSLADFKTVGVRHCPHAFGVALTGKDGWKLTYSGDTLPCDSLATLGQFSDVLIHEATMEDELKEEAMYKMHSTTSEAIAMGKKMNAKFTLLTHFSQRYSKVPKIDEGLEDDVGIAFDNMCVRLSDLPRLHHMYPALKQLFAEHYEEMEMRTAKKLKRKEMLLENSSLMEDTTAGKSRISQQ